MASPVRHTTPAFDGARWDVSAHRPDASGRGARRAHGTAYESMELVSAAPRDRAPFEPTQATGYEIIGYADLGDREQDPVRDARDGGRGLRARLRTRTGPRMSTERTMRTSRLVYAFAAAVCGGLAAMAGRHAQTDCGSAGRPRARAPRLERRSSQQRRCPSP